MMHSLALGALFLLQSTALQTPCAALQTPLKTEGQVSLVGEPLQMGQTQMKHKHTSKAAVTWQEFSERITPPSSQTLVSMTLVVSSFFITLFALCSGFFKHQAQTQERTARSMLLDNAKVVAQFLIIYTHLVSYDMGAFASAKSIIDKEASGFSSIFNVQQSLSLLYTAVNMVTVPLLCFISGVLSQGPPSDGRIRRFIQSLVVPTLIWIYVIKPVVLDTMMDPSVGGFYTRLQAVWSLNSFHDEWYLQALFLWRGAVLLIFSHLRPPAALVSMLMLSCIGGYLQFTGPLYYFKLDQAFGYLPYFGIGYVFPFENMRMLTEKKTLSAPAASFVVMLWTLVMVPYLSQLPGDEGSYTSGAAGSIFEELNVVDHTFYWTRRLARVALEMPVILLVIFCLIPRCKTFFTWVGPHLLYPFLFHGLAIQCRNHLVHQILQSYPVIEKSVKIQLLIQLSNVLYALIALLFLASRPWRMLFSWALQPTWLEMFFNSQPEFEDAKHVQQNVYSLTCSTHMSTSSSSADLTGKASDTDSTKSTPNKFSEDEQVSSSDALPVVLTSSGTPSDNDDDDAVSVASVPELVPSGPTRVDNEWRSTGPAIPWQSAARSFYPWMMPIFFGQVALACVVSIIVSFYAPSWQKWLNLLHDFPLPVAFVMYAGALAMPLVNYVYHFFRLHSSVDLPEPTSAPPLIHAVVVCAYKEPLDVLCRTMDSIVHQRGLSRKPVVVFAAEARDPTAQSCFTSLSQHVGNAFESFLLTRHELKEGETIGKSSNENWAVQELYRLLVKEQANDPFEVMITIVDADSVLSSTYLAHVEASFRNQRDGRRLIYNGPLNVLRNFADASLLVQSYEMSRCHGDVFHDPFRQYVPQSNYSLTLGLCQEIDFWTPDVMPEDIHTLNKARLNNFGGWTCVAVPSIICNDLVTDFGDRYTQAKRHQYGSITEFAWVVSLYKEKKLSFQAWAAVLIAEFGRQGAFLDVIQATVTLMLKVFLIVFFVYHWDQFNFLEVKVFALLALCLQLWKYLLFWFGELLVWVHLMPQFKVRLPSLANWCALIILMPVFQLAGDIVFCIWATIDGLVHLTFIGELAYVCAPKGEAQNATNATHHSTTKASETLAGPLLEVPVDRSEPPVLPLGEGGALAADLLQRLGTQPSSSMMNIAR